jgi:hypothetical protein
MERGLRVLVRWRSVGGTRGDGERKDGKEIDRAKNGGFYIHEQDDTSVV